jgi:hypothetical protein
MRAAVAALVLPLALCAIAKADTLEQYQIAGWNAGAYSNDATGAFDHCAMSANYRSGTMLLFAVNSTYHWTIGFANPKWNLTSGSRYDLAMYVDGRGPINATATAIAVDQVEVPVDDDGPIFQKFRKGYRLTVYAAGDTFQFDLDGTSAGLASLVECTNRHLRQVNSPTQSNPFVAAAPPPPQGSGDFRAEATTVAANLLSLAGATGYHFLEPTERPKGLEDYDVVWQTPDYLGALNVLPMPDSGGTGAIVDAILSNDAKSCRGTYGSQRVPQSQNSVGEASAFSACKTADLTLVGYYTAFPRRAGGYYITYIITIGDDQKREAAEALDQDLRSAAFTFLKGN